MRYNINVNHSRASLPFTTQEHMCIPWQAFIWPAGLLQLWKLQCYSIPQWMWEWNLVSYISHNSDGNLQNSNVIYLWIITVSSLGIVCTCIHSLEAFITPHACTRGKLIRFFRLSVCLSSTCLSGICDHRNYHISRFRHRCSCNLSQTVGDCDNLALLC